jgi:hypothetical protein
VTYGLANPYGGSSAAFTAATPTRCAVGHEWESGGRGDWESWYGVLGAEYGVRCREFETPALTSLPTLDPYDRGKGRITMSALGLYRATMAA